MAPLHEARVVITGVGRAGQVGEAVAQAFVTSGASLWLLERDRASMHERAEALGPGVRASACDLTDSAAVNAASREIAAAWDGRVDALVNVAGGFAMSGKVAESDRGLLERQIAINLTTAYVTSRAFLPMLRAARGAIVFFGSAAALPSAIVAEMSAYAIAKTGVLTLMRAIAQEEVGLVRANAVAPATIRTADNVAAMGANARYVEREAVADAVLWLCSDAARGVTGQVLPLG